MKRSVALLVFGTAAIALVACDGHAAKPARRSEAPAGLTAAQLATNAAMAEREKAFAAAAAASSASMVRSRP